jgi:phospholipid transport system substrate-binding protein
MSTVSRRGCLLAFVATSAATLSSVVSAQADSNPRPAQPINDLHMALEAAMQSGRRTPFAARFDALAPVIERVFDLETVLKVSVGMRWSSFDEATQERLAAAFHRFTIATYVANFDRYSGEKFVVIPGARASGSDRIVRTEVASRAGGAARLDYVMRQFGYAWRAVDVLIDGSISRVAVQRSDFRTVLARGDADALIRSLQRKVADLSEGALSA